MGVVRGFKNVWFGYRVAEKKKIEKETWKTRKTKLTKTASTRTPRRGGEGHRGERRGEAPPACSRLTKSRNFWPIKNNWTFSWSLLPWLYRSSIGACDSESWGERLDAIEPLGLVPSTMEQIGRFFCLGLSWTRVLCFLLTESGSCFRLFSFVSGSRPLLSCLISLKWTPDFSLSHRCGLFSCLFWNILKFITSRQV